MTTDIERKEPSAWVIWAEQTDVFIGTLIVFSLIIAVAVFFAYIGISNHLAYSGAPFHQEVECTAIRVDEIEREQEVYDDYYKDEPEHIRKQHMKTEKYKVYVSEWEYYINDERKTLTVTDKYLTTHKVGDKMTKKMYSRDGVEYKFASFDGLTDFVLGICLMIIALFTFLIVGVILERIKLAKKGKLKKKRKKKR
ncbi:MAG: hypothetical protein J6O17_02320 [Eubacterium sp.]|nr:hypothetical protein [Eubacterium sp.]